MAKDLKDFILKLQKINANLAFVSKRSVAVGWVYGNKRHKPKKGQKSVPPSLAQIAKVLNYGSAPQFKPDGSVQQRIPPRPFMSVLKNEYGDYLKKVAADEANKIVNGTSNSGAFFKAFGVRAKGALQRAMRKSDEYVPNAPSTIKQKGSSRPLFDTGTLIRSVDYEVRINK